MKRSHNKKNSVLSGNTQKMKSSRLVSLDVLRGFDMFFIIGGREVILAVAAFSGASIFKPLNRQLHHVQWEGFVFWDLIMPLFLFMVGASMSFSFRRKKAAGESLLFVYAHIFRRFFILYLLGLLIAGVDFTGLAIIAGALSVGIGLGMQTIANNIVSGIILLLEKPIKPGDRVIVGDTEGFVKKVRLRSTQITTLAREDVIVPNAELIANKVTNFMFRDKHWRVTCQVGVAYGSNVELIREKLLEVAANHEDVLQGGANKPVVMFKQFGDSSLVFELWCIIRDVNKKYYIASDLHFEIDKIFRENSITIAFPQRDLHIKNWQAPLPQTKD